MNQDVCDKIGYETHRQAMVATANRKHKSRHVYSVYRCKHCGYWHVTTASKNLRKTKKDSKYPFKYDPSYRPADVIKQKKKGRHGGK